jgi:RimK family alpha-L-glutamate ligase
MLSFKEYLLEQQKEQILFISFPHRKKVKEIIPNSLSVIWNDIKLENGKMTIKNKDISTFKKIFVGVIKRKYKPKVDFIKKYIKDNNIPHLFYIKSNKNKSQQQDIFEKNKIPTPKTIYGKVKDLDIDKVITELKFPIISKILNGSKGVGVEKHDDKKQLEKFFKDNKNEVILFQRYIENESDIRVFFFKGKILFSIERTRQNKKEFRNNISLGAKQKFITLPKDAETLCNKINKVFDLDFAGIDLIKSSDNKWYVLEVNESPQFKNKENKVIPEIKKYFNKS